MLLTSKKYNCIPAAVVKWSSLMNLDTMDWKSVFNLPFKVTKETKLQAFQYSILHRFVPHKRLLYLQNLVTEETCDHCGEIDTILHRFYECLVSKHF